MRHGERWAAAAARADHVGQNEARHGRGGGDVDVDELADALLGQAGEVLGVLVRDADVVDLAAQASGRMPRARARAAAKTDQDTHLIGHRHQLLRNVLVHGIAGVGKVGLDDLRLHTVRGLKLLRRLLQAIPRAGDENHVHLLARELVRVRCSSAGAGSSGLSRPTARRRSTERRGGARTEADPVGGAGDHSPLAVRPRVDPAPQSRREHCSGKEPISTAAAGRRPGGGVPRHSVSAIFSAATAPRTVRTEVAGSPCRNLDAGKRASAPGPRRQAAGRRTRGGTSRWSSVV